MPRLQSSGLGMAAIRDLSSIMPLNYVSIPPDVVAKIGNPAYQRAIFQPILMTDRPESVPTVAITNILVTRDDVSDEVAYQMTKLMFDNLTRLGNSHSAAKDIKLENAAKNLPIRASPRRRTLLQGKWRAVTARMRHGVGRWSDRLRTLRCSLEAGSQ